MTTLNDDFMIYLSKYPQTFHLEIMWIHENHEIRHHENTKKRTLYQAAMTLFNP